jgi:hypothetical protein
MGRKARKKGLGGDAEVMMGVSEGVEIVKYLLKSDSPPQISSPEKTRENGRASRGELSAN